MIIARKLKTARQVLRRYGLIYVFVLLRKNIMTPVIRIGRKLGSKFRRAMFRTFTRLSREHARLRILYVTTTLESENGQTIRYRVFNRMESLMGCVETHFELLENGIVHDRSALGWADLIVLLRVDWSKQAHRLIKTARELNIPLVYDIDDLIFSEKYADLFCIALNDSSEKTRTVFRGEFFKFAKVFDQCDFATASTEYIAQRMRKEGKTAFVIPNGFNLTQQRIAEKALQKPRPAGVRYIAYLSGTRTHDRDLMQAIPALTRVVQEYPDVRFRLIGFMDETLLPPALAAKTDTAPFMSWKKLVRFAAESTINIAPLEISNPFCHAKSELKYFESAIVGVPTVASPTDTFRRCIENGVNGLLADGEEQWYAAFHTLLDDPGRYASIRAEAMRRAYAEYSPRAVAARAEAVYRDIFRAASATKDTRPQ